MMQSVLLISFLLAFHPVHVSLMSIDKNAGTDSLDVFLRIYYDDFLLDYQMINKSFPVFDADSVPGNAVELYIDEKVRISADNNMLKGKLLDLEIIDNEMNLKLVYPWLKEASTLGVNNRIMTELYPDMANFLIVRVSGKEEGFKMTPAEPEIRVPLN